ncbi:MAG: hypothetical protein WC273_08950 [Dehalococcoidia bacterium]
MPTYRETTRAGVCMHCGSSTVQACEACENFVCAGCEATHNAHPRPDLIVRGKPAG